MTDREHVKIGPITQHNLIVFTNLDSNKYTQNEKALAIYKVLRMPTKNGISKEAICKATKWLWDQLFELSEGVEK